MPPNKQGGKNYKKGKHINDEPTLYERQEDQMYGRVLKLLGGCNVLVYCNDDKERLCHIRGSMRKKVWIDPGDIVLISVRDLTATDGKPPADRGDVCAKYDSRLFQKLKDKDPSINSKLFVNMGRGGDNSIVPEEERDGFVFEADAEENSEEESDNDIVKHPANRVEQRRAMTHIDDDFDIDDI